MHGSADRSRRDKNNINHNIKPHRTILNRVRILLLVCIFTACEFNPVIINPNDKPHGNDSTSTETPDQKRDPAYLFDNNKLPRITVTLTEKDWNQYLKNFDDNPNNGLYVPAQFRYEKEGKVYDRDSVGLRQICRKNPPQSV